MNENARKWVEALRSGEFEQGPGGLRDRDRYCCLGVACEVHRRIIGGEWDGDLYAPKGEVADGGYLPLAVQKWLGMASDCGTYYDADVSLTSLAKRNDYGMPFTRIANIIESEPAGLFQSLDEAAA